MICLVFFCYPGYNDQQLLHINTLRPLEGQHKQACSIIPPNIFNIFKILSKKSAGEHYVLSKALVLFFL